MQPGDPVVGGTILRRVAIASPNFVHLLMGWSINQDGTAEFNGLTINGGEIILTDGSGNVVGTLDGTRGLVLYGNGDAVNPGLILSPFGDLSWGNFDVNPHGGPAIEVGSTQMFLTSGADVGGIVAAIALASDLGGGAVGAQLNGLLYGNNQTSSGTPVPAVETWHALPLSNGWANSGGAVQVAQYRAMPDGTVVCRGSITGGVATTFATLPAQYRPAATLQFPAGGGTAVAAGNNLHIVITSAGVMTINGENALGGSFAVDSVRFVLPTLV